ncbi:hypothetical protein A1O1_08128 [Capronia coronata CBS 617.96]|uniref:LsmAD domain-containing protein n=1 Tax=Capronia coronata CBS 617.96 TaxID=1182541 RepID=W9YID5_9EURO|nr:uncharacterized protein A1O1_08128 [Capronia coronata CBS 617.96]EXJ82059.1 hypothetical protein A1O1_08128 [Capronia coronata CBS 617.96]
MASAASITANSANSSGTLLNNHPQQNSNGSARTAMRTTSNTKAVDAGRKQSPVDGVSRRPSAQKAWGSSSNPISQRGSVAVQQNGSSFQTRSSNTLRSAMQKEAGVSDKQAHDRLVYLFGATIGLSIAITVKSGDRFEGLLTGSTLNPTNSKITMKMVRKSHPAASGQTNGTGYREAALVGSSPEHAMNFDVKDIADLVIPEFSPPENFKLANGTPSGFQTDADISGNQTRGERLLQKWVPEGPDAANLSLESGTPGSWDQFSVNSQLFGAKSTYDETLYTTVIDRNSPSYKRREAEAERIAREIEGAASTNPHIREERGQALENDGEDEEEKYSGVRRAENAKAFPSLPVGGPNKYTPPARRAPTGQATVAGVPVDPAIISASLSGPEISKPNGQKAKTTKEETPAAENPAVLPVDNTTTDGDGATSVLPTATHSSDGPAATVTTPDAADGSEADSKTVNKVASPGPTENVEVKVLNQFRQFADLEKQRVQERRKAQQNQDRTTKLNELLRFSKTFKLKTPIPNDLIGILAKDPAKQEAIVEKAQKEHAESASVAGSASPVPVTNTAARKADAPQASPAVPDRQVFNRGRGGITQPARTDRPGNQQQPQVYPARNNNAGYQPRFPAHQQDRKGTQPHALPAPIPIIDGRVPPTGPMADQSGLTSPQRSNMHTPTSAISGKFNLNVKASEFRPTAATFNPSVPLQTPSSPASTHRGGSISRTASPSLVFGHRKPKPSSERPSIADYFNPIKRMKEEFAQKSTPGATKPDETHKDYSANGGMPWAFQTGPRWTVKTENDQKTYEEAFEQHTMPAVSPSQSRSGSAHHLPFAGQGVVVPNAPSNLPHIAAPQHAIHGGPHQYPHQYDDGSHRMQFGAANPGVYPSPNIPSRQASAYASPMTHPAQLAYQQQPYFGTVAGQMPMPVRPFAGTPGMMHAQVGQTGAPMMVQQPSNGPYMAVPQQFNHQMPMYSPNPGHVYPQQNGGYSSPGRVAPMMMQQGSQQGHPSAPNMMFSMSNQGGPIVYPQQQMAMPRGGYGGGHQYGSTPHQGYAMQHRAISGGYGQMPQKMHPAMQQNHGSVVNGPAQGPAFGQMEGAPEDAK